MRTKNLPTDYDYLAPDTAEVRLLLANHLGGICHCILPHNTISKAVKHKSVSELWYILSGEGEIWRKNKDTELVDKLSAGVSIEVPVNTSFQYKSNGETSLVFLCITMPPWPGHIESIDVDGYWKN